MALRALLDVCHEQRSQSTYTLLLNSQIHSFVELFKRYKMHDFSYYVDPFHALKQISLVRDAVN
jgi:hypothetical protein